MNISPFPASRIQLISKLYDSIFSNHRSLARRNLILLPQNLFLSYNIKTFIQAKSLPRRYGRLFLFIFTKSLSHPVGKVKAKCQRESIDYNQPPRVRIAFINRSRNQADCKYKADNLVIGHPCKKNNQQTWQQERRQIFDDYHDYTSPGQASCLPSLCPSEIFLKLPFRITFFRL